MITMWDVYWITRLDGFNTLFVVIVIAIGMALMFGSIPVCVEELWKEDNWKFIKRLYKIGICLFVASLLGLAFTPSTKEAVAIYIIPKIANNEQVQKLPDNAFKFLNKKFEQWVEDKVGKEPEKK